MRGDGSYQTLEILGRRRMRRQKLPIDADGLEFDGIRGPTDTRTKLKQRRSASSGRSADSDNSLYAPQIPPRPRRDFVVEAARNPDVRRFWSRIECTANTSG